MDWQNFSVSLAQGVDTKTDPKQLTADYLVISNAVYGTLQQLNPRPGFTALTNSIYSGSSITAGNAIGALNNSLVEYDGSFTYSYSTELSSWIETGQKKAITTTQTGIGSASSPYFQSIHCAKASNGLELYVWIDRQDAFSGSNQGLLGFIYFSVFDPVNNIVITTGEVSPANVTNATCIQAQAVGSNFFIITADTSEINIFKAPISAPNFVTATPTFIANFTSNNIDTCASSTNIYILADFVYAVNATTLAVTTSSTNGHGIAPGSSISYDSINNRVWAIKGDNTGANTAVVYDSSLTILGGPTVISSGGDGTNVTFGPLGSNCFNGLCYVVGQQSIVTITVFVVTLTGSTITATGINLNTNAQVYSRPVLRSDGFLYFILAYMSASTWNSTTPLAISLNPIQPTSFLVKIDPTNLNLTQTTVVSRVLPNQTGMSYTENLTGVPTYLQSFWPPAPLISSDGINYIFPNQITTDTVTGVLFPNQLIPSASIVRSAFQFGTPIRTQSLANNLYSTGGYISGYDFNVDVENNFHLFPEITSTTASSHSGGGGLANGTYSYIVVFSWIDSLGQVQRSGTSNPATVVIASAPEQVSIAIAGLYLTDKQNIKTDIYRTTANGTIYFYLASINGPGGSSYLDFITTPTTLELYTTGGQVDNSAAPAASFSTTFKNRLFIIPTETPLTLWYSQQVIPGVPVQFSTLFTMNLDQKNGSATALAVMDDKLVVFCQRGIFYVVGTGPAPSGANNDFSYPQFIPSDSGVTEPDSVVGYPEGVFFKGKKGLYLLDRALNVSYIGAPVEAYNQFTITSSQIDVNKQIVKFTLGNSTNTQLVYDYYVKKWSVNFNIAAVSATISNSTYYYLQSNGAVQQETPGIYSDNGSVIPLGLTSGWLSFARLQGFQRVKNILLLGKLYSNCTVTVGFAYDFNPTITQTTTIVNSNGALDPWQWRVFLNRQKCEALQITITVTPTAPGQALALSNIGMEIGIKTGMNKLPAAVSTS